MKKIHLVCNAHLDPVWTWEWEEGAATAISTFRTAADLCETFEGFVFNHNEAILYRWVEELEPELFIRIQKLVEEGKWHIMGGWYLQPDCNMPSGESFVRQILLGRNYFNQKFDIDNSSPPTTAINFDPFGHTRGLVQILAKSGYNSYIVCRPDPGNRPLPAETFWWQGLDDSRILVARGWGGYLSALGKARQKVDNYLNAHPEEEISLVLWGVGNHGGGPSYQDLRDLESLISEPNELEIQHSTPERYFSDIHINSENLPVYEGDLNPWGVGCYTSQIRIKQKHRQLENEIYSTEKMISAAWCLGRLAYPQQELLQASQDLAFGQFHDILPGTSIQPVEDMALRLFDHGLEVVSRLKARAFFALAAEQKKANENEVPILVYNPHPYPIPSIIECEFQLADQNWEDTFTTATAYQDGLALPSQVEKEMGNINLDWRKRIVFKAILEPSQMNRFDCRLERIAERPEPKSIHSDSHYIFTNGVLEIAINTRTGFLDHYLVDGIEFIKPDAFQPIVIVDNPDPWGMTVRSFRQIEGFFEMLTPQEAARFAGVTRDEIPPVRVIEDGSVRTVVEILLGYKDSRMCMRYKLPKTGAEVELEIFVHWNEKDRMLKLSIPVINAQSKVIGQVAYGTAELVNNGEETVAQKWCAVVDNETALTIINNGTYGLDYHAGDLRINLLRSPAYAAHPILERPILPEDRYSPRQDQGERRFRFWFQGGKSDQRIEQVDGEALAHNESPPALSFFPNGTGEPVKPFIVLSNPVVQLTAMKKAEQGDDLIIRLFEPTGQPRKTTVEFPVFKLSKEIALNPFEIVTLRLNPKTGEFRFQNLLETDQIIKKEI